MLGEFPPLSADDIEAIRRHIHPMLFVTGAPWIPTAAEMAAEWFPQHTRRVSL